MMGPMTTEAHAPWTLCVGITPCLQRTLQCERFSAGDVNRVRSVTVSPGGKAVNVARALATLKGHPLVTGFIGGDNGRALISLLDAMKLEHDFVSSRIPTRICTTALDEASGAVTEFVEEAPPPAEGELGELTERVSGLLSRCGIVIAAGALPPLWPDDTYARLASAVAASGLPLIIDTHGAPLLSSLASRPVLTKLNHLELAETCQCRVTTVEETLSAMRTLVKRGTRWILVTHGPQSAWLASDTEVWKYTPPSVSVLNTIGSGDAATAGTAHALRHGLSMPEAARVGMACGAANSMTLTPGEIDAAAVDYLLEDVKVERII